MKIPVVVRSKSENSVDKPTPSVNRTVVLAQQVTKDNLEPIFSLVLQQLSEDDFASFKSGSQLVVSIDPAS